MNQLLQNTGNKNGFYKEEIQNGFAEGQYENGVKIGQWTLNYPDRIEKGEYKGRQKVGQWVIQNISNGIYELGEYDDKNLKTGEWCICKHQNSECYLQEVYQRGLRKSSKQIDKLMLSKIQIMPN